MLKPIAEQDLYELLEVARDATDTAIAGACARLEAAYAPDSLAVYGLMSPDEAALLGARLAEARAVLLDPASRRDYDERLSRSPPHPAPARADRSPLPLARPTRRALASGDATAPEQLVFTVTPPDDPTAANEEWTAAPAPILLSREVPAGASPIPLATPAPVSPPFAAVADATVPSPRAHPAAEANAPAVPESARTAHRASARARLAGERELFVPEGTRYTGEVLRRAREARGLTIEQVCDRTKVLRQHLENLEADRHDRLPVAVYLRGILMALSKELRLDGQKVARSYLEAIAAASAEGRSR